MAILLVTDHGKDAAQWHHELSARVPGLEVRGWPAIGAADEIEAVLSDVPLTAHGGFTAYSNLAWVHFLGHGAGDMLLDPSLPPGVPVTRQRRDAIARSLTIYVLQAVTAHHLQTAAYRRLQQQSRWHRLRTPAPSAVEVGVLGLGVIGRTIACRLRDLGYRVTGWSRSGRDIEGVSAAAGPAGLQTLLPRCDFVIGVLPETRETTGLIARELIALMKPGVYLVNVGRGSLIVEDDLLDALDSGHVAGAALDVFAVEPLPETHRFWSHPGVILTPHVGGPAQDDAALVFDEIAENYRRLVAGEPLLNVVDPALGY